MILHCDGNSFYASCEEIYRPDLRGKPIVVLSNNDGILIALNRMAKTFGLRRGDPFFKVEDICKKNNITVFSSNYTLYADISRRITSIYLQYAPKIEEYSIDESFLFFDKCDWKIQDFEEIGFELKNRILKEVGIPICVGAAPSKTLAKLYNKNAKNHNGVYVYNSSEIDGLLKQTLCQDIWGIGRARAKTLYQNNIKTAYELKNIPMDKARKWLTVQGVATVRELNGFACIDRVDRIKNDVITSSRQFGVRVYDMKTIECAIVQYTELAVERLRLQGSECGVVSIFLSTCNYYSENREEQFSDGISVELPRMTCYTPDIVKAAQAALPHVFRLGYGYKTIMITLSRILPAAFQGELWVDPQEDIKKMNFMDTLDEITQKYGRGALTLAKGFESTGWEMKREFLSPCWTTRYSDFPKVW